MALKNYKIEYEDGTETYLQLDNDDVKVWEDAAGNKNSPVKKVTAADPEPFNDESSSKRASSK